MKRGLSMRRSLFILGLILIGASTVHAEGRLIPTEKTMAPLAMVGHHVKVAIDEQVAVTQVEQTFLNDADKALEADYFLPVPRGADVRRLSISVGGKEIQGEVIESAKAREIYHDVVRRTLDPSLLAYMNSGLLKVRLTVPAKADLKISISFTALAGSDNGLIEYVYPMSASNNAVLASQGKFSLSVRLQSQHPLQNIYSPSHTVATTRANDREATVVLSKEQAVNDKDFRLYYTISANDVGLSVLTYRPSTAENGYFMLLVSPREELARAKQLPRDMVFLLDTSTSMRGQRITQARNALKYLLRNLSADDQFAVIHFNSDVHHYNKTLQPAAKENLDPALRWVDALNLASGTNINAALLAALDMRPKDASRTFTIAFFTDGQPTVGVKDWPAILQNVTERNTGNTRIFTFGVGDDVNASMLDALAQKTRATSTFVRESEDIEIKVSDLFTKINSPVLENLKLTVDGAVKQSEVYPPQLPDLFRGSQLVVLGRYSDHGKATIELTGNVGSEKKVFTREIIFPEKSAAEKSFVADLWARRKVGYLLDQIRLNGEKKEMVDEIVVLAKRFGITTPYTSYLVVPERAVTMQSQAPQALAGGPMGKKGKTPQKVADFAKEQAKDADGKGIAQARGSFEDRQNAESIKALAEAPKSADNKKEQQVLEAARKAYAGNKDAGDALNKGKFAYTQSGALGVDLSVQCNNLRYQNQLSRAASRVVLNRTCLDVGGVWIDDMFDAKTATVTVKAMSNAYFRLLEKQPGLREVFCLGNHIVWIMPSGTALIIDQADGREELEGDEIDRLFSPK